MCICLRHQLPTREVKGHGNPPRPRLTPSLISLSICLCALDLMGLSLGSSVDLSPQTLSCLHNIMSISDNEL